MRNLTLSLVLAIITATFGLGWLLSQLYGQLREPLTLSPELRVYQELAVDLAATLDASANQAQIITSWREQARHRLSLQDAAGFSLPPALGPVLFNGEPLWLEADGLISVYVYLPQSGQVLGLDIPRAEAPQSAMSLDLLLTIGFYLGLVLIIVIWLYPLISQLNRLRDTARQFGEGNLAARLPQQPHSYIGDIEREFNAMAARIEGLIHDNKLLSRAVSHDLKTPLARLRFGVDTLAEAPSPQLREKYVNRLNDDLNTMEGLINTLLDYAQLDEANVALQLDNIDLNQFMPQLLLAHTSTNIQLQWMPSQTPAIVRADPRYLSMQINNLIDNALQYARAQVQVTVAAERNNITLLVEDDGPGLPEDQLARLLQPFQRGSQENRNGNHGMGLAISSKISQWFKAELQLGRSALLQGAEIKLIFIRVRN